MTEHIYDDSIECAFVNDTKRERIVRCRDCKYYLDRNGAILPNKVCQRLYYYNFKVKPDGFCAWGERRDA